MSLFVRPRAPQPEPEQRAAAVSVSGANAWFYSAFRGDQDDNPLRSVAHWAARRVLCTSVAGLPVDQVRERSDGSREEMPPSLIVRDPDGRGDREGWVYQVMDSWLDNGNVFGLVTATTSLGLPTQVVVVDPSDVSWRAVDGEVLPHIDNKPHGIWPRGDIWHAAAFLRAGSPIGLSPSVHASQSVRTALAAEKFGGDFFNGSHPSSTASVNRDITADQARQIKDAIKAAAEGREVFVHGRDIELKANPVNPTDSQFIELLRFECEQAARIYGVPPSMIYAAVSGQNVTYANVSDADLAFMKHSLRWWVRRLQNQWSRFLPTPHVVRFNLDAFLEGTPRERAEINEIRLRSKTVTVNEVRAKEDAKPFPDPIYDQPGIPDVPASNLGGAA